MKANYLATSLCLAPALAAPLFSTSTVLVAGSSAKTVVVRPAHQAALEETAQVAFDGESISRSSSSASVVSTTTTTDDAPASTILDAERPLTTQELMELTQASHKKGAAAAGGASKIKISVGTLVVPGGGHPRAGSSVVAQFLDPKNPRPFLVSGYYIPAQRLDVWAAGVIVSFFLVVVGLELWGLVRQSLLSSWRREGSIKLDDSTVADERGLPVEEYEDDSEDEDDMAPFSGYSHHAEKEGLRLPEKVDSKAGWI